MWFCFNFICGEVCTTIHVRYDATKGTSVSSKCTKILCCRDFVSDRTGTLKHPPDSLNALREGSRFAAGEGGKLVWAECPTISSIAPSLSSFCLRVCSKCFHTTRIKRHSESKYLLVIVLNNRNFSLHRQVVIGRGRCRRA